MSDLQGVLDEMGRRKREGRTRATEARKEQGAINIRPDMLKARKQSTTADLMGKLTERKATERRQRVAAQHAQEERERDAQRSRTEESERKANQLSHVSQIKYIDSVYKVR